LLPESKLPRTLPGLFAIRAGTCVTSPENQANRMPAETARDDLGVKPTIRYDVTVAGVGVAMARRFSWVLLGAAGLSGLASLGWAQGVPERRPAPIGEGAACANLVIERSVTKYCVSSVLKQDSVVNRFTYGPENLFDRDDRTAWVEGAPGHGIGEWIIIEFDGLRQVKAIEINNGYNKEQELYLKNSRVKEIKLEFSDRRYRRSTVALKDSGAPQPIALPNEPVLAYWVKLSIESVYPGMKFEDTAISELHVVSEPVRP